MKPTAAGPLPRESAFEQLLALLNRTARTDLENVVLSIERATQRRDEGTETMGAGFDSSIILYLVPIIEKWYMTLIARNNRLQGLPPDATVDFGASMIALLEIVESEAPLKELGALLTLQNLGPGGSHSVPPAIAIPPCRPPDLPQSPQTARASSRATELWNWPQPRAIWLVPLAGILVFLLQTPIATLWVDPLRGLIPFLTTLGSGIAITMLANQARRLLRERNAAIGIAWRISDTFCHHFIFLQRQRAWSEHD